MPLSVIWEKPASYGLDANRTINIMDCSGGAHAGFQMTAGRIDRDLARGRGALARGPNPRGSAACRAQAGCHRSAGATPVNCHIVGNAAWPEPSRSNSRRRRRKAEMKVSSRSRGGNLHVRSPGLRLKVMALRPFKFRHGFGRKSWSGNIDSFGSWITIGTCRAPR